MEIIWTDDLGNSLWSDDGAYVMTTVMTRTPIKKEVLSELLSALAYEFDMYLTPKNEKDES